MVILRSVCCRRPWSLRYGVRRWGPPTVHTKEYSGERKPYLLKLSRRLGVA